MRPVALSVVEGRNFLLGTFDTSGFQTWWKSLPFPGDVESIEDPTHVYGQYHVCIAKMRDGTYSIYRTHDSGKTWTSVYNTNDVIYSITTIDYGWVIASTSTGWLESTADSGLTWNTISNFAPGCRTVINVSDDILFAHDCNFVWKSIDRAKTWSKVLDVHNFVLKGYHSGDRPVSKKWTGYCPPALDGYESRIVAGCGPYIAFSDDLGISWSASWPWYGDPALLMPFLLPYTNRKILQIIQTDIRGRGSEDGTMMIRLHMIPENYVRYLVCRDNGARYFDRVFDLPYKGDDIGKIAAYNVQKIGTSQKDLLAIITSFNSGNHTTVEQSIDGGLTWSHIDANNAVVYEGNPEQEIISDIGQYVFEEEFFVKNTWIGTPCHNSGRWITEYNKAIYGVSWDVDIITGFTKPKSYGILLRTLIPEKDFSYTSDVINKTNFNKSILFDVISKSSGTKSMIIGGYHKTNFTQSNTMDMVNALISSLNINKDIIIKKSIDIFANMRMNQIATVEKTYCNDMILVDNHVNQIMNSIEKYTSQAPDIRYPNIPYDPYDSRTQDVV